MGRRMDLAQAARIDAGIDLRGRQRGMAKQCLDRAEIRPRREKMRRKSVAQSVRRCRIRQAQQAAQPLDEPLDQARVQRAALRPPEQRLCTRQRVRALFRIEIDRVAYRWYQRHDPYLTALAGDPQAFRRWHIRASEAEAPRRYASPPRRAATARRHRGH